MKTTSPFRFGDRINATWSLTRPIKAEIDFLRFLKRQGFKGTEDIFRYFFFDIFHDGYIRVGPIDLEHGVVKLSFSNEDIYCKVSNLLKRPIPLEPFFREFTFKGVSSFEIHNNSQIELSWYYSAEFWKRRDRLQLAIYFSNIRGSDVGTIKIEFKSLYAAGLSPKLAQYAISKEDLEWWQAKKPISLDTILQQYRADLRKFRSLE